MIVCDALPHSSYQNFWFALTQVFKECWSGVPCPPPPNEKSGSTPSQLKIKFWSGLGTWDLSWSGVHPPQMKIWSALRTWDLSWFGVPCPPNENWHLGFALVRSTPPPPTKGRMWELVCGNRALDYPCASNFNVGAKEYSYTVKLDMLIQKLRKRY